MDTYLLLYLKLIVPKGYHAETINFRTPTLETASFKNGSIYNYLPPQYVRDGSVRKNRYKT